jgi:hypothetical protein
MGSLQKKREKIELGEAPHLMNRMNSHFIFIFEEVILIGLSPIFWEHWAFPNSNTSLDN